MENINMKLIELFLSNEGVRELRRSVMGYICKVSYIIILFIVYVNIINIY